MRRFISRHLNCLMSRHGFLIRQNCHCPCSQKDQEACWEALNATLKAMREPWHPEATPLYRYLDGMETNILSERVLAMLQEEMINGDEFAFMKSSQSYQQLLQELKQCNNID